MPRVYSRRKGAEPAPDGAVYVGRPTPFGNPFVVGFDGKRGECIDMFREWIMRPPQENFREWVRAQLRGKDLVCWCAPEPCHADVLLEIANS